MLLDKLLSPEETWQVSSNTTDPGRFRQSWLHHLQGSGQNKNVRPQTGVVSPLHKTVSAQFTADRVQHWASFDTWMGLGERVHGVTC